MQDSDRIAALNTIDERLGEKSKFALGVKKLLMIVELARQDADVAGKFVSTFLEAVGVVYV